jgi:hypothetical protein
MGFRSVCRGFFLFAFLRNKALDKFGNNLLIDTSRSP